MRTVRVCTTRTGYDCPVCVRVCVCVCVCVCVRVCV